MLAKFPKDWQARCDARAPALAVAERPRARRTGPRGTPRPRRPGRGRQHRRRALRPEAVATSAATRPAAPPSDRSAGSPRSSAPRPPPARRGEGSDRRVLPRTVRRPDRRSATSRRTGPRPTSSPTRRSHEAVAPGTSRSSRAGRTRSAMRGALGRCASTTDPPPDDRSATRSRPSTTAPAGVAGRPREDPRPGRAVPRAGICSRSESGDAPNRPATARRARGVRRPRRVARRRCSRWSQRIGTPTRSAPVARLAVQRGGGGEDRPGEVVPRGRGLIAAWSPATGPWRRARRPGRSTRPPGGVPIEAWLWVRSGEFLKARESLAPLGEAVRTDPALVRLHARVLVGSGLWVLCDDEFQKVLDAAAKLKAKTSAPAVAFLLGVIDVPADAERAAWVAAKANSFWPTTPLRRWRCGRGVAVPTRGPLRLAHPKGGGLPPVWDADRVTAALTCVRATPARGSPRRGRDRRHRDAPVKG